MRWEREEIERTCLEIEQLRGEVPEGLTGKGLEFTPSCIPGAKRVYMNGTFVTTTANALFGSRATNGRIVAWLVKEQIDYCSSRGPQIAYRVFAWHEGLSEPKEIFEDHAYAAERNLSVSPPVVAEDGTITVIVCTRGEEKLFTYQFPP